MKIIQFFLRIIGLGFFVAGLFYFLGAINSIVVTTNLFAVVLRIVNGAAWLIAGYGLLRLQKWSLHAVAGLIVLFIATALFNWYGSGVAPTEISRLGLRPLGFLIVLFFLLLAKQKEFFNTSKQPRK